MRLLRIPEPFNSEDLIFDPKIDGFRALAYAKGIAAGSCPGMETSSSRGRN